MKPIQPMKRRAVVRVAACAAVTLWGCAAGQQAWAGSYDDFFAAIVRDDAQAITGLLRRGFDPNTVDAQGNPGLIVALQRESANAFATLLQARGLKINQPNAKGETALMMAAIKGRVDAARALIARGADVNQTGWTALHYAASSTSEHAVALLDVLIEHHAYIDAESPNASTPLMLAAQYGTQASAQWLLAQGADPTLKNERGMTAVDFAQRVGRQELAQHIARAIRQRQPSPGQW